MTATWAEIFKIPNIIGYLNWRICFNSAVCCTQFSFLLLLHKVEAFIGKKNTLLFTINHSPLFFQ